MVSQQYKLPIFSIVMDNTGWNAVKQSTLRVFPEGEAKAASEFESELAPKVAFTKVGEAFGAYGEEVSDPPTCRRRSRAASRKSGRPLGAAARARDENAALLQSRSVTAYRHRRRLYREHYDGLPRSRRGGVAVVVTNDPTASRITAFYDGNCPMCVSLRTRCAVLPGKTRST